MPGSPDIICCNINRKLARKIIRTAIRKEMRLVVAESCTAGMVSASITGIPGSSPVFECAFITYSNASKSRMLGVEKNLFTRYGAVSPEVAREMALGAIAGSGADIAISVTGIAGPGGGSISRPVGTVWFGIAARAGYVATHGYIFNPPPFLLFCQRSKIRTAATRKALELLVSVLNRPSLSGSGQG